MSIIWNKNWLIQMQYFKHIAQESDKSIKLYTKDNWFCYSLAWILFFISFGQFKRTTFLTKFATTIGNYIFFPKEWNANQVANVIHHEFRHVQQSRFFGLGIHPLCGLPLSALIYLFLPVPIYGALGRLLMEWDADMYQARQKLNLSYSNWQYVEASFKFRPLTISSAAYLWTVPKKISIALYQYGLKKLKEEGY